MKMKTFKEKRNTESRNFKKNENLNVNLILSAVVLKSLTCIFC